MARLSVTLALLFLACACASPVPGKIILAKNSSIGSGFGIGALGGRAQLDSDMAAKAGVPLEAEAPIPGEAGETDIALVENVNTGSAFSAAGGRATGVSKNNQDAPQQPFPINNNMFAPFGH
ncbi:uncharacterized protein LOC110377533 isoform X1 [Helicoverpa armigera]|uniref:uncharacterized protein LOC110377533 isoform X1 n=1 Tax=Helicoverpa armigera TaxID=29058 RepID=UPI002112945E|nr:uncharacterized protein LOC110377533 isoform X1 [Helicoverpa armigera]